MSTIHRATTIWLDGRSDADDASLARSLGTHLEHSGHAVLVLDADIVSRRLCHDLHDSATPTAEATVANLVERAAFLEEQGFALFDIVDMAYYCSTLHQVDLVFISKKFKQNDLRFAPFALYKEFQSQAWMQVTRN